MLESMLGDEPCRARLPSHAIIIVILNMQIKRVWDENVCFLCGLRFEPCDCSYNDHWRLTWSLTSGPVGLVEVRTN
jgi:hypothetical protein